MISLRSLLSLFFFFLLSAFPFSGSAQNEVKLYLFWAKGCSHCEKEKEFLAKLENQYPESLQVIKLEVTGNKENTRLMQKAGQKLNVPVSGVPLTIIGRQHFVGWGGEELTGKEIQQAIDRCIRDTCPDVVGSLMTPSPTGKKEKRQQKGLPETINVPVIGKIETKNLSLPVLTIIIAAVDGFNPCAMWALLFLISLLLPMESKRRKWILGFAFILASAVVYFIFMAAWLNLFLFIGFIFWVRILVGIVALYAGFHYLRAYYTNPEGTCEISEGERKKRFFAKLKTIVEKKSIAIGLIGIILLSFSVNLIEMVCSAGLPAVYAGLLSTSNLLTVEYYLYLGLYILIFLFDDLMVFIIAMATLQSTGVATKYTRISQLAGGVIMIIIGLLLIFKPEWLMFG